MTSVDSSKSAEISSDLIARAAALPPKVAAAAGAADAQRSVPAESVQAVVDAGLIRILTPERFGGYQLDMATHTRVAAEIARHDGSLGWISSLCNAFAWATALYPLETQEEVWADGPDVTFCSSSAFPATAEMRKVDGGALLTGRWGWSSGSLHARWAWCSIPVNDAAGNHVEDGMALFPLSEARIEDTWHVAGMRGTGSNTILAEELFVPDRRIRTFTQLMEPQADSEYPDIALYRTHLPTVMRLTLAAPLLGMARAALELVIEKAPQRAVTYTSYDRQDHSVAFQVAVGEGAAKVDSAFLHAERAAADLDRAANAGEELDLLARARIRSDLGWVCRQARESVDMLASAHGTSGFAEVSPLQRIWRDIGVASRHAQLSSVVAEEVYGKALLGIDQPVEHV